MREPTAQALLLASALGCLGPVARAQPPELGTALVRPRARGGERRGLPRRALPPGPVTRYPGHLPAWRHRARHRLAVVPATRDRAGRDSEWIRGAHAARPSRHRPARHGRLVDLAHGHAGSEVVEEQLIEEWLDAGDCEARRGAPFARVVVMGFSNGAYYGASLALRGRLAVDGYALFAGGGAEYLERQARRAGLRPPIYVGYGGRDPAGRRTARLWARPFAGLAGNTGWSVVRRSATV